MRNENRCQFVTQIFLNPPNCLYLQKVCDFIQNKKITFTFTNPYLQGFPRGFRFPNRHRTFTRARKKMFGWTFLARTGVRMRARTYAHARARARAHTRACERTHAHTRARGLRCFHRLSPSRPKMLSVFVKMLSVFEKMLSVFGKVLSVFARLSPSGGEGRVTVHWDAPPRAAPPRNLIIKGVPRNRVKVKVIF